MMLSPLLFGSDIQTKIWISRHLRNKLGLNRSPLSSTWRPRYWSCNDKFIQYISSPTLNLRNLVRCVCFPWPFPSKRWHVLTPSYFVCLNLLSWQLWAPTVSSHTAHHLLHFTDCGCSKAKFTAQSHEPHKPTPLVSVPGALRSAAPLIFYFIFFLRKM